MHHNVKALPGDVNLEGNSDIWSKSVDSGPKHLRIALRNFIPLQPATIASAPFERGKAQLLVASVQLLSESCFQVH